MKGVKAIINGLVVLPFLLALSTVFIVSRDLGNGVITSKYFWFYAVMTLVPVASLVAFFCRKRQVTYIRVDRLFLWLTGLMFLPFIFHSFPVFAGFEFNFHYVVFLLLIALYFFTRVLLSQFPVSRYILMVFFIITGLVEAVWGLLQLYGFTDSFHSEFRITGSFSNPGPYAGYLACVVPVTLHYILRGKVVLNKKFRKYFLPFYIRYALSVLTLVGILFILPATQSRASWLGALLGCCWVFFYHYYRQRKQQIKLYASSHKKQIFCYFLVVSLVVVLLFTGMYLMKKDSVNGRFLIWKNGLQLVTQYPFGVGLGHFPEVYGKQQIAYFSSGKGTLQEKTIAGSPEYAFNEYIQLVVELGIIPSFFFFCLLAVLLYEGIKRKKTAEISILISLLVFAGMSYPFRVLPFLIVAILLAASIVSINEKSRSKKNAFVLRTFYAVYIFLIILWNAWYQYPAYQAHGQWKQSKALYSKGLYADVLDQYAAIHSPLYRSGQADFLFEYAQLLSQSGKYEESNTILSEALRISCDPMLYNIMGKNHQALRQYTEAERCFLNAANMVPNRLFPYYLLAKMYQETGEVEKAKVAATLVLTQTPKVYSESIREMREEMQKLVP